MKWQMVKLQQIASNEKGSIVSGPFGSNISAKFFVEEGIPVIRGNNLTKGKQKFIDDGFVYLTETKATEFRNCIAIKDDIVFTAVGSIGQVGIIPSETRFQKYVISNKQLRVRIDNKKADPMFVYYWLSSPQMTSYIEGMNNGGAVPLINLGIIRRIAVPLPPVDIQANISANISVYDDMIDNNQRRIQLLEESAQLLFREWFVYFRFPGHEKVKIVDGIPEGWEKESIKKYYDTSSGGTPSRRFPEYFSGEINWVKTQELGEKFIFDTEEKVTQEAINKSSAKIFPVDTLLITIYGVNIGETGILAKPAATNQACVAFFPKKPHYHYIYLHLYLQMIRDYLVSLALGSAQTNISQDTFRKVKILMPDEPRMNKFISIVEPIYEQIKNLQFQNQKLAQARDLLLPRLMSGAIEV